MAAVTVIGSGAWGCAIARLLVANGHDVLVWAPFEEEAARLESTRRHPAYPDVELPEGLHFTASDAEASAPKDLYVMAVASPFTRSTAKRFAPLLPEGARVVTVTKGIEEETLMTQVEIISSEMKTACVGALSGPSHAEEVIRLMPTTVVSAAADRDLAEYVQDLFMSPVFRVYTSYDVTGVELGGSLKNVIALAAGMADGMGYGDNAKAALITRGIHEISHLAIRMGAKPETLYGLAGMGDLIVTCASMHSRNRRAGILIGQGKSMEEAMAEVGQVVEGVYSARAAGALARKYKVELPIIDQVNRVLFEGKNAREAVTELMQRDRKMEIIQPREELPETWQ